MTLRLKNRTENPRKKILIYGLDGTGKSTYAERYCNENGLNPIVIDVDDTNYTNLDILDLKFANDMQTYTIIKNTIKEIGKSDYDTIILDGVSSLLEMLTSKARGLAAYSDRAKRWNDILFEIENTRKNVIFIGQIDCDMLWTEDYQPSKAIIKVNSLVNEKYECFISEKGEYEVKVKKFRTLDSPVDPLEEYEAAVEAKSKPVKPKPTGFESANEIEPVDNKPVIENYAKTVAIKIIQSGDKLNKVNMRKKVFELVQLGEIPTEIKEDLYTYINENCPGD